MTSFDAERILGMGGAGVIAREALERLSDAGARVLSVDRLPLKFPAPAGVDHLVADLAVADLGLLIVFAPTRVLHLAATFERSVELPGFWAEELVGQRGRHTQAPRSACSGHGGGISSSHRAI